MNRTYHPFPKKRRLGIFGFLILGGAVAAAGMSTNVYNKTAFLNPWSDISKRAAQIGKYKGVLAEGFDELIPDQSGIAPYSICGLEIETKGQVRYLRKVEDAVLREKKKNGDIVYEFDNIEYRIKPEKRFLPQNRLHDDAYVEEIMHPDNTRWMAIRPASIKLCQE